MSAPHVQKHDVQDLFDRLSAHLADAKKRKSKNKFPTKNEDLRARWSLAVRGPGWAPSKYSKVCSKHFEERFLDRTGQTCRIRENAIPTLLLDPSRVAMAISGAPKMEMIEPADPLGSSVVRTVPTSQDFETAMHATYQCEHHEEVLSQDECNKLMYSLDLGDGRKIKLIYSVPKGHCSHLF